MSKPKKSKSEVERGEGGSFSTNTGGGIKETCIIHFLDVTKSDTVILLSTIENPSERLQKLNDICRQRLLEPLASVNRMTDVCYQVPSSYSEEHMYGYHRECFQRFTGKFKSFASIGFPRGKALDIATEAQIIYLEVDSSMYSKIEESPEVRQPLYLVTRVFLNCCAGLKTFSVGCDAIQNRLVDIIQRLKGKAGCANGGEKCLYTLSENTPGKIKAVHETPVQGYKDDLTFTLTPKGTGCDVNGFSTSETWYAWLDKGTNYCNLRNLIDGADLSKDPAFKEETSDSVCTQYSSRDCDTY